MPLSDVPRSPERFFGEYVPEHFAKLGDALRERSSPGAVAFEVGGSAWALSLRDGRIVVEQGVPSDTLLRIALAPEDFEPVIVAAAERLSSEANLERQLVAARALSLDDDRARMLRETKGTVLLRLTDEGAERRVLVTLGAAAPSAGDPECELACTLGDLWSIQSGAQNPMQLLLDGKIRLQGKLELALAVGAALG